MAFLDNYEDVAARIARLWLTHPTARVQTNIVDFNAEKGFVLIQAQIFREYETCYSEFLDRANPKPFREFLLSANKIYWLLGYCTTAIAHICTCFRSMVLARQSRRLSFDNTNVLLSRLDLAVNRHRNRDSTLA